MSKKLHSEQNREDNTKVCNIREKTKRKETI